MALQAKDTEKAIQVRMLWKSLTKTEERGRKAGRIAVAAQDWERNKTSEFCYYMA